MNEFVKDHVIRIKNWLNVDPAVFYGQEANEKILEHVDKKVWEKNKKTANGFFNPNTNEVYIFNVNESDQFSVGVLAHELRHAYQWKLEKELKGESGKHIIFNFITDFYSLKDEFYKCRKSELDANYFAYKYCKKNKFDRKAIRYYKKKKDEIENNRIKHTHTCP